MKVLIYLDSYNGTATAVACADTNIIEDNGHNLENWPVDLHIYERGHGLYMFEGEMDGNEEVVLWWINDEGKRVDGDPRGGVRTLTPAEWAWLRTNEADGGL